MNLINKVNHIPSGVETLKGWLGENATPVDKLLAQARANTCIKCVKNIPGDFFTSAVMFSIRKMVEFKNGLNLKVAGEKSLGACGICTCDLKTKIWVPISVIRQFEPEGEREKYPDYCWQKSELE